MQVKRNCFIKRKKRKILVTLKIAKTILQVEIVMLSKLLLVSSQMWHVDCEYYLSFTVIHGSRASSFSNVLKIIGIDFLSFCVKFVQMTIGLCACMYYSRTLYGENLSWGVIVLFIRKGALFSNVNWSLENWNLHDRFSFCGHKVCFTILLKENN